MILLDWYRDWLELRRDLRMCQSCEILKTQVEQLRYDNVKLMDRVLEKPQQVEARAPEADLRPIANKHISWSVRKQMLEAEDRKKAQLIRESMQVIDKLEEELDLVGKNAESETS